MVNIENRPQCYESLEVQKNNQKADGLMDSDESNSSSYINSDSDTDDRANDYDPMTKKKKCTYHIKINL